MFTFVVTVVIYFAFLFVAHGGWNYETRTCEGR
jgi:hypothetical protein